MKIYHTETQADYDALMVELEAEGVKLYDKEKLESSEIPSYFGVYKYRTCIMVDGTTALYNPKDYYELLFPDVQIIKYKAKECAEAQYVIEFGEYFYKKSCNDSEGTRSIIVTSKVKEAYWFSCKENAIEVSKLVGGVVKGLTTQITEVLE